jgi:acyl carrier protein
VSKESVLERVQNLIANALDLKPSEILPEQSFRSDLGADSLDSVEIIMAIEDEFGVQFEQDAAAKIETVGDLIMNIETALSQKSEIVA